MTANKHYNIEKDIRYLELLSKTFPTVSDASTEIINLQAILHLPKGTEHFLADIHGEYEAFQHVLKNASGTIKRKVNELLAILCANRKSATCAPLSIILSRSLNWLRAPKATLTTGITSPCISWWLSAVTYQANTPAVKCGNRCQVTSVISFRSFCTSAPTIKIKLTT